MLPLFATGVNGTGGKFAAGVVDTEGNLPPASLTPVEYLPPVSLTLVANLLLVSRTLAKLVEKFAAAVGGTGGAPPRIFEQIQIGLNEVFWGWGETDS